MITTQVELEREMWEAGRARAATRIQKNEDEGRAGMNPYAQAIFRRFVLPLADAIDEGVNTKGAGRRAAHVTLLAPIDPESVAYIAVRVTLTLLLSNADNKKDARAIMYDVGKSVYHEYLLTHFADVAPDLFYTLVNDFERRHTGEDHRLTVFKRQAKANNIEWHEWGLGAKDQVGAWLIEQLSLLGMVEINKVKGFIKGRNAYITQLSLSEDAQKLVGDITTLITETTPYAMPCIEKPKDWISYRDGGWHTTEMRRILPHCVTIRAGNQGLYEQADMGRVLQAINTLQGVEWRINKKVLDTVLLVAKHMDMDEIISQAEVPRPCKPMWLTDGLKKEEMSPDQLLEFRDWKHQVAEWHTEMKLRGTKTGRFYTATRIADKFKDYPKIFFVYGADFRGRLYSQTTGINPQGSDMQKALLEFAVGKPLLTPTAVRWFCVAGANRFGYDKATLAAREAWVMERADMICNIAADPLSHREWMEADAPLQFLAWCFEFSEWRDKGKDFLSRVAVGMDGSCNGLQNFSAMLRDEVGGKATNLIPADKPSDIYHMVADVTAETLRNKVEDEEDKEALRKTWLAHGINRTLVKRSVMTLPYGSVRYSCAEFIEADYLKAGKVVEFPKERYRQAANYLSFPVWDAIGVVVVKAREAMQWLQAASKVILDSGELRIGWVTPSGFPVIQSYWEREEHRINTKLCGSTKIVVKSYTGIPAPRLHKNGIAPNFVHSLDASHLALTVNAAAEQGITSFAMIHDDYGTHAADAEIMYHAIRDVFVRMYEDSDPMVEFANRYGQCEFPALPTKGSLDLKVVRNSEYFFS